MKPEHDARRKIIREWMSLPREKRQTAEQASAFAMKAIEQHDFRCSGNRQVRIMARLIPASASRSHRNLAFDPKAFGGQRRVSWLAPKN
jgi:hypothetical protein